MNIHLIMQDILKLKKAGKINDLVPDLVLVDSAAGLWVNYRVIDNTGAEKVSSYLIKDEKENV